MSTAKKFDIIGRLLTPKQQREYAETDEYYEDRLREFRAMDLSTLRASTKMYMRQMEHPKRCHPKEPVYDSTFWYIIIPELLRRLSDGSKTGDED